MKLHHLLSVSILFLSVALALPVRSQSPEQHQIESRLTVAKEKFETGRETEALEIYESILDEDPKNYEALWNTALLYANAGHRLDEGEEKEEKYRRSMEIAEKVVELYPEKGHSHYAYAVAKGRMTEIMGTRDRINASHEIKESIKKAADRIPDYAPVWHLYGVWHSDVANVSAAEKAAARFISKGIPDASNEKAEEFLKKAARLDKQNILFRLDLARHYLEIGKDENAEEVLSELVEMEPKMKDDSERLKKARDMLNDLK